MTMAAAGTDGVCVSGTVGAEVAVSSGAAVGASTGVAAPVGAWEGNSCGDGDPWELQAITRMPRAHRKRRAGRRGWFMVFFTWFCE